MKILFSFLILLSTYLCAENKGELLKGTIISSDKDSETLENAFDGDAKTEFVSSLKSNGWVGLELEVANRITKIGWMQKDTNSSNYFLGVFEGANEETFMDAFPLYMITKEGKAGEMNYVDIDMTYAFKYLRYVGPNAKSSVISGIEFYGFESSTKISKEEEKLYQPTNLPLMIINTENAKEPQDKATDINCNIVIVDKGKVDKKKKAALRLRGNSTTRLEKRPYKFRFEDKEKLLDLPNKSKKWNLMANHVDKTLIRNTLAFKISELFEMPYTPQCRHVDLIINGEYKGNYGLCEKIEVGKGKIQFNGADEVDGEEGNNTMDGYVIESNSQDKGYYKTAKGIAYFIRYPDEEDLTEDQREYIENSFNEIEAEGYDGILDKIDADSFVKYVLIGEFCADPDTFWSTYMSKSVKDDKLYFGPIWDFDLSFGNDMRTYSTVHNESFLLKASISAGTMKDFGINLLTYEPMMELFKETWKDVTEKKMSKKLLLDYIDEQAKYLNESQYLNFKRWDVLDKRVFLQAVAQCTYEGEINYLKEYISTRYDIVGKLVEKVDTSTIKDETTSKGWGGGGWGGRGNGGGFTPNFNRSNTNPFRILADIELTQQPGGGGWGGGGWGGMNQVDQNCINMTKN